MTDSLVLNVQSVTKITSGRNTINQMTDSYQSNDRQESDPLFLLQITSTTWQTFGFLGWIEKASWKRKVI